MTMYLPQITLATVVVAGVIDGINPCAFSVLLLFITALTSTLRLTALLGHSYLPLSNVVFILPLVVILIAASSRPTLVRLARRNLHHKE